MGREGKMGDVKWAGRCVKQGGKKLQREKRKTIVGRGQEKGKKWDGAVEGTVENKMAWKRRAIGAKGKRKTVENETEFCLLVLQWRENHISHVHSHTHAGVCQWTTLLGTESQMQNTLEKLTAKPTNKVPVKLLLRKWSHIFLGYHPVSTPEVWSNKRINLELLCAVAKQVSKYPHKPGL